MAHKNCQTYLKNCQRCAASTTQSSCSCITAECRFISSMNLDVQPSWNNYHSAAESWLDVTPQIVSRAVVEDTTPKKRSIFFSVIAWSSGWHDAVPSSTRTT